MGNKILWAVLLAILVFGICVSVSNWMLDTKQVFIERRS